VASAYQWTSSTLSRTVKAKNTFETWAKSNNVQVRNYHADNGRFQDNLWRQDCETKGQGLTFCGVNAHWQNGLAEKRIRDLVDMASVMLNYAQHKWPAAISTHLWPYALKAASDTNNSIPKIGEGKSPLEIFSSSNVRPNFRNHHHFGCPLHAKSVALVLSLKTGLVSPQFHCQFDDTFKTVKGLDTSLLPVLQWQEKAFSPIFSSSSREPRASEGAATVSERAHQREDSCSSTIATAAGCRCLNESNRKNDSPTETFCRFRCPRSTGH